MTTATNHDENNDNNILTNPKNSQGIIFDIDGTLADSWKLGYDATQVVLQNNDIPPITEELYHDCTRFSTPDRLARHAGLLPPDIDSTGDEDDDGSEYRRVGERLAKEFDELYVGLVSLDTAGFYDGIGDMIHAIPSSLTSSSSLSSDEEKDGDLNRGSKKNEEEKGSTVKIAALTNACVAYAHAVLKINCPTYNNKNISTNNIYQRFESIHGADTVPKPKPSPDGLYQCCDELGLSPDRCVYIGDSPSDAVAAKDAGMVAIGVLWGSHSEEKVKGAPFDFVCRDVDELRQLLPQKGFDT